MLIRSKPPCYLTLAPQLTGDSSNVVAYAVTQHPPLPYRLKSSTLRFQIPSLSLSNWVPDTKFFRVMRESNTWRGLTKFLFTLRTWSRRTIWGDRVRPQLIPFAPLWTSLSTTPINNLTISSLQDHTHELT